MSDQEGKLPTVVTQVTLQPKASQTFLVAMVVLSGISVVTGGGLFFAGNPAGWAFLVLSIIFASPAMYGWHKSQSDTDLHSSSPTTFTWNGATLSTDSRNLRNSAAAEVLLQIAEVLQRVRLPDADGIIENGEIVPNSATLASDRVKHLNDEVDAQNKNLDALVTRKSDGPAILQRPTQTIPPDQTTSQQNEPTQN